MSSNVTILIIENHPAVVDVLVRTIREVMPTAQILTASDGIDGVSQMEKHSPNFIIIELALPKLNGYDLIKAVPQLDPNNRPIIIGISSGSLPQTKAFYRLCDASLTKPFYPTELQNLIARLSLKQDKKFLASISFDCLGVLFVEQPQQQHCDCISV